MLLPQDADAELGQKKNKLASVMLFKLVGNIFRSGTFNQVLNTIATDGGSFKIIDLKAAPTETSANDTESFMIIMIRSYDSSVAEKVTQDIFSLGE